ncbi:hypothetical protein Agub_g5658 [Astrephomene gubernaculifera]|uniref:Uncharacterized protein n=1 Tax=Astrephomene gubernaculifera TaxID=47775 RepID=A0AAD3DPB2_9CHLO|nr:hypothetical protein Agub_g5658 [Astrephomene gubernaculifera]
MPHVAYRLPLGRSEDNTSGLSLAEASLNMELSAAGCSSSRGVGQQVALNSREASLNGGAPVRQQRQVSAPGTSNEAQFAGFPCSKTTQGPSFVAVPPLQPQQRQGSNESEDSLDGSGMPPDGLAAIPKARRRRSSWAAGAWPTQMATHHAASGLEALSPDDLYRQFVAIRDAVLQKTTGNGSSMRYHVDGECFESDGRSSCPAAPGRYSARASGLFPTQDDSCSSFPTGRDVVHQDCGTNTSTSISRTAAAELPPECPAELPVPMAAIEAAPAVPLLAADVEGQGMEGPRNRRRAPAQHRGQHEPSGIKSPHRLSHATYADSRFEPDRSSATEVAGSTATATVAAADKPAMAAKSGQQHPQLPLTKSQSPEEQGLQEVQVKEQQQQQQQQPRRPPILVDLQHFFRSPPGPQTPSSSPCASPSQAGCEGEGDDVEGVPRPLSPFQGAVSYAVDCMRPPAASASPCNNALYRGAAAVVATAAPATATVVKPVLGPLVASEAGVDGPCTAAACAGGGDAADAATAVGGGSGEVGGTAAALACGVPLVGASGSIPHTDSLFSLQPSGEPQSSLRAASESSWQEQQLPLQQQTRSRWSSVGGKSGGGGAARLLVLQEDLPAAAKSGCVGSGNDRRGAPVELANVSCDDTKGGEAGGYLSAAPDVLSEGDMVCIGRCTPAGGLLTTTRVSPNRSSAGSTSGAVAGDSHAGSSRLAHANAGDDEDDRVGVHGDDEVEEDKGQQQDANAVQEDDEHDMVVRSDSQGSVIRSPSSRQHTSCSGFDISDMGQPGCGAGAGCGGVGVGGGGGGFTSDYQRAMDSAAKRTLLPLPGIPTAGLAGGNSGVISSAGSSMRTVSSLGGPSASERGSGAAGGNGGSNPPLTAASSGDAADAVPILAPAPDCNRSTLAPSYVPLPLPGLQQPVVASALLPRTASDGRTTALAAAAGSVAGSPGPGACKQQQQPAWLPSSPSLVAATASTVRKCLDKGLPFAVIANEHFAEVVAAAEQHDGPLAFHILSNHATYFPGIGRHATSNGGGATDLAPYGSNSNGSGGGGFGGGLFRRHASAAATAAATTIRRLLDEAVPVHVMSPCEYQRLLLAVQYGVRQLHDMLVAQPTISTAAAVAAAAAASASPRAAAASMDSSAASASSPIGRRTLPLPPPAGSVAATLVRRHRRGSSIGSENSFTAAVVRFKSMGDTALSTSPAPGGGAAGAPVSASPASASAVAPGLLQTSCRVRALVAAALQGNVARVAYLVEHGADVNATEGPTHHRHHQSHPLLGIRSPAAACEAASSGAADATGSLDSGGGGASGGRTALHYAAEAGSFGVVQLLLHYGAFVGVRDGAGRTAYDLARRKGHEAVAQLLKDAADRRRDVVRSCAAESKAAAAAADTAANAKERPAASDGKDAADAAVSKDAVATSASAASGTAATGAAAAGEKKPNFFLRLTPRGSRPEPQTPRRQAVSEGGCTTTTTTGTTGAAPAAPASAGDATAATTSKAGFPVDSTVPTVRNDATTVTAAATGLSMAAGVHVGVAEEAAAAATAVATITTTTPHMGMVGEPLSSSEPSEKSMMASQEHHPSKHPEQGPMKLSNKTCLQAGQKQHEGGAAVQVKEKPRGRSGGGLLSCLWCAGGSGR